MENADDDLLGIAAMATAPEGAGGAAEPSEGDDDDPDIEAPADAPVDAIAGLGQDAADLQELVGIVRAPAARQSYAFRSWESIAHVRDVRKQQKLGKKTGAGLRVQAEVRGNFGCIATGVASGRTGYGLQGQAM